MKFVFFVKLMTDFLRYEQCKKPHPHQNSLFSTVAFISFRLCGIQFDNNIKYTFFVYIFTLNNQESWHTFHTPVI